MTIVAFVVLAIASFSACGDHKVPVLSPKPVQPAIAISPSDAPKSVDEDMNFVLLDLIQPARMKISDLQETPETVKQQFPEFIAWLTDVSNALLAGASLQGSLEHGRAGMQEFIHFSGIHYQCDPEAGCHDLLGSAAEVESADLNNAANVLLNQFHAQSPETRKAAADYLLQNFSVVLAH